VIAAVCHGPAGLVTARRADGEPLVAGKRVTAFTNAEEDAVGLTTVVPFLLESRLRELGADFVSGPNWLSLAVRDGRLITGQNPASSAAVADHVMTAITEARYHNA
jgi:putative intracellular protease/amidase